MHITTLKIERIEEYQGTKRYPYIQLTYFPTTIPSNYTPYREIMSRFISAQHRYIISSSSMARNYKPKAISKATLFNTSSSSPSSPQ